MTTFNFATFSLRYWSTFSDWNSTRTCFIPWKIYQIAQLIRYFSLSPIHIICLVSGLMFDCAARAVNQQLSIIHGMTQSWGKGVRGPLSVWWTLIFSPSPLYPGFILPNSIRGLFSV